MEEWLKIAGAVIAFCALWWKITSSMAQMATKSDLAALRQEFKSEMAALRQELKADAAALRQELKVDAAALQEGLSKEIRQLRELLFVHVSDHEKHRKSQ
ncbi:MAG: hypothetical protein OXN17_04055 [Candidatus Poribacteria bacterium]|nr:hypothetical protein [Candidatus Poribacteria bacterium]MDE0505486.1 hypothetical protein [Candidatus Poribacteria bacterium]